MARSVATGKTPGGTRRSCTAAATGAATAISPPAVSPNRRARSPPRGRYRLPRCLRWPPPERPSSRCRIRRGTVPAPFQSSPALAREYFLDLSYGSSLLKFTPKSQSLLGSAPTEACGAQQSPMGPAQTRRYDAGSLHSPLTLPIQIMIPYRGFEFFKTTISDAPI